MTNGSLEQELLDLKYLIYLFIIIMAMVFENFTPLFIVFLVCYILESKYVYLNVLGSSGSLV